MVSSPMFSAQFLDVFAIQIVTTYLEDSGNIAEVFFRASLTEEIHLLYYDVFSRGEVCLVAGLRLDAFHARESAAIEHRVRRDHDVNLESQCGMEDIELAVSLDSPPYGFLAQVELPLAGIPRRDRRHAAPADPWAATPDRGTRHHENGTVASAMDEPHPALGDSASGRGRLPRASTTSLSGAGKIPRADVREKVSPPSARFRSSVVSLVVEGHERPPLSGVPAPPPGTLDAGPPGTLAGSAPTGRFPAFRRRRSEPFRVRRALTDSEPSVRLPSRPESVMRSRARKVRTGQRHVRPRR